MEYNVYGFAMARVSEVYLSTLSSIMAAHGLERYFFPLLYIQEHSGTISQKELSDATGRDKVSTTRMVDYLCERAFVERKKDPTDKRCHLLHATPKADDIAPRIKKAIEQTNDILFDNLDDTERAQFTTAFDKIIERIQTLPTPNFIVKAHKREQ